jgi:abhydrolase domain-containing protein 6
MKRLTLALISLYFLSCNLAFANIPEKTMSVDGGQIKYYQIGQGHPVLLLHGLFANKKQWLALVDQLAKAHPDMMQKFQFIIPDLPGYGRSSGYPIEAYNLDSNKTDTLNQVQILHDFIKQLQIGSLIDFAGNSMGGLIMVLYAVHYPSEVNSMAFIGSPLGIADYTSEFINTGIRRGYNPFTPTTMEQFINELRLLLVNYVAIMPSEEQIKTKILPRIEQNFKTMTATYNMVSLQYYKEYLQHSLKLTQPVLVLWGDKDYIFGSSAQAKVLCHNLAQAKNCISHTVENAGHLLMMENQQTLASIAQYYQQFLRQSH